MADNDTIADIIAEMRKTKYGDEECEVKWCLTQWADRLEAAHKRERGDAAKLREALAYLFTLIDIRKLVLDCDETEDIYAVQVMLDECRAALAAPPRNCDRFATKFDAKHEWEKVCKAGLPEQGPFEDWIFYPATEKEGGNHASK